MMRHAVSLIALGFFTFLPAGAAGADEQPWLDGLPAVSEDGSVLAVANHESLGARGDERLLLDFIEVASGRRVRRVIVSDPDYPESRAGGEAKARAVLAERTWVKLRALDVREDEGAPWRQGGVGAPVRSNVATGGGLEVQYREPALLVRDTTSQFDLVRGKEPTWSHPAGSRCAGCDVCPAPLAILENAWSDRLHGVLLVQLSFGGGSDTCWEPPDDFHAVALPPMMPHS
jgi:hypothetical protein